MSVCIKHDRVSINNYLQKNININVDDFKPHLSYNIDKLKLK